MVTPEGIFKQADTHFTAWRWLVKKLCLDKERACSFETDVKRLPEA